MRDTLVSIVVPFFNEIPELLRAAHSALAQTHSSLELILVDDGSTDDTSSLETFAGLDRRVRLIRQRNGGPGAARNAGLQISHGSYVAFLDADDIFFPQKIQRQLAAMQDRDVKFAHTSYYVTFPERHDRLGIIHSGLQSGDIYPSIIAGAHIATPTVMMHRSVVDEGFLFPTDSQMGEDVLSWIWIAQRHEVLGINEPLTIVEWSSGSAAINLEKSVRGLAHILQRLKETGHSQCSHYDSLVRDFQKLTDDLHENRASGTANHPPLNESAITSIFG